MDNDKADRSEIKNPQIIDKDQMSMGKFKFNQILTDDFDEKLKKVKTEILEQFYNQEARCKSISDELIRTIDIEYQQQSDKLVDFIDQLKNNVDRSKEEKINSIKEQFSQLHADQNKFKLDQILELEKSVKDIRTQNQQYDEFLNSQINSNEPISLNVRGQTMEVGRKTLTTIENSKLTAMFSGQAPLKTDDDGRVFLDRDPEVFKSMINYITFDREILPGSLTQNEKKFLEFELKFWQMYDQKYDNFMAIAGLAMDTRLKYLFTANKVINLFNSVPEMYPNAPEEGLSNWRKLEPIKIEEILLKSQEFLDIEADQIEYNVVVYGTCKYEGFIKRGTNIRNGLGRLIFNYGQIQEGMFRNNQLNGFGRLCFQDGAHYTGRFLNYKKHGQGKQVDANGRVEEGEFKDNKFID